MIPSNDDSNNTLEAIPNTLEVGQIPERSNTAKDLVVGKFPEQNNTLEAERLEASESSQVCLYTERPQNITNNLESLEVNGHCNALEVFNFESLLTSTMQLPTSWMRNNTAHKEDPLISFSFLICDMVDGKYYSYNLKEVIVDSTLQLHTHVLEKPLIDSPYINVKKSITSVTELEEYLRQIHSLKVCPGIVIPDICEYEKSDTLYTDKRNVFRRKTCTLLCHSSQCNACQNAKRALVRKRKRNEIGLQDPKSLDKKSRSISSTINSGNTHVRKLKQKLSRSIQQKRKLRLANGKLRRDLKSCQKTMSLKSEESVLNKLRSNDVAKNQCAAVQEILKASRCQKSSGRRYSENWLMLCMLLYMRSTSGYNFIRDNNILPLPCVSTMRR